MTREELLELDAPDLAEELNKVVAEGKSQAEVLEAVGLTKADIMKAQVFWVKDKYIARAWGGYTSTKRTGNEMGDAANGVGGSDPSLGYNGV
ncbi:MAG: hypothetical protein Q4E12_00285 [Coriobacteriia bacterium]|nr:hypothetical protein [Coriobacteriia bacterium]